MALSACRAVPEQLKCLAQKEKLHFCAMAEQGQKVDWVRRLNLNNKANCNVVHRDKN